MQSGSPPGEPVVKPSPRLEQLERDGRFPELASELLLAANRAAGEERAELLARLAETRLRMDDIPRALTALRGSLDSDPNQGRSRRWLEKLLSEPDHALDAADALQPIYEAEFRTVPQSAAMLLAVLELRATRTADHDERIAYWAQMGGVFDLAAALPEHAREIAVRLLSRTALEWPGGVGKWIERVMRLSTEPNQLCEGLLAALNQALSDPLTVCELSLAAGHALEAAGRGPEARPLYDRALEFDATSPEILSRIDKLAEAAGQSADERAQRFRTAIERADGPERRAALRVAFARVQRKAFDDLEAAAASLREAVAEAPSLLAAHEALVDVCEAMQDFEAMQRELERALSVFTGSERHAVTARLCELLLTRERRAEAVERARALLETPDIDAVTLDRVQDIAQRAADGALERQVHERRVELAPDVIARSRALESFGEFLVERADERLAAAAQWKRAADILAESGEQGREVERLYERALEITPDDTEAAVRLIELSARGAHWSKLPAAFRTLIDAAGDPAAVVDTVLELEAHAIQSGGIEEFAIIADDVVARLETHSEQETRALVAAKARVMASSGRFDEAARVYEALIESFADEHDVRAFVDLVESSPDSEWRHAKRCWLFEWRAGRAEDPIAVLMHWATVEEQEFSDAAAAIAVLERAAARGAERVDVFRELARLKLASSDLDGALSALARLRELTRDAERVDVSFTSAEIVLRRLERPLDALPLVERLLDEAPRDARARALAFELCQHAAALPRSAAALERASANDDEDARRALLTRVLAESEVLARDPAHAATLGSLRRRWFEALISVADPDQQLALFERVAAEFPEDDAIWQAVEARAVQSGKPDAALRAYEAALSRSTSAELAEALGRRVVAFAEENVANPRTLTPLLERLLEVAPGARWAFHRVKLALGNEQRWDTLFSLYDRTIASASHEDERAALLDEAAVAARDLANDAPRAIGYFERYFALRPADARVDQALERLYERQRQIEPLIAHLTRREANLEPEDVVRLKERVAGLWLDIGNGANALSVIESLPKSVAHEEATLALLERVFALVPGSEAAPEQQAVMRRAARLLKQRYAALDRALEVARVIVLELASVADQKERIRLLTQLADLRRTLDDAALEFDTLGELMLLEPEEEAHRARLDELSQSLGNRERLAQLTVLAAERASEAPLFAALLASAAGVFLELGQRDRAIELFSRIVEQARESEARLSAARRLETLLLEAGRAAERCAALEQVAALSNVSADRRRALLEAARVALDQLGDPGRAARAYESLLAEEPRDLELIDGLLRALSAAARFAEVVAVLERRAELVSDRASSRRDLAEAARIRAHELADGDGAIAAWLRLRERFGRDAQSFDALSALYESAGRWSELASLLADEAAESANPQRVFARLAEVHERHTGDLPAALQAYRRAELLAPAAELFCAHAALVPDAAELSLDLAGGLRSAGQGALAERVLRRQIEHYGPRRPRDGVRVHLALADLLGSLGEGERAQRELELAAERYPESEPVLGALGALAYARGDLDRAEQSYRGLLMLLARAAEHEGARLCRAEVYVSMSDVARSRGDEQRASDYIASAFEWALASEQEALALEVALKSSGRADLVQRAVTARLERARDPERVATALRDLLELSSADGVRAPGDERASRLAERALRDLESAAEARPQAWHALLAVFDRLGESERALAVLQGLSARAATETERGEHELLLARRLLAIPGRREEALSTLRELARHDHAQPEVYELLLELTVEPQALDELLTVLRERFEAARAAQRSERAGLLGARLAAALERAGRWRDALDVYAELAREDGQRRRALEKMVELTERFDAQNGKLAEALDALLGLEPDADRAAELALRLAELRGRDWDEDGVERALEQGFERAPAHAALTDRLVQRLLDRGAAARAVEVLERALEHSPERAGLRLRLAEVLARADRPERALAVLDAALAAGAPEPTVRRERARIFELLGRAEEASSELERVLTVEGGAANELLALLERTALFTSSERWALRAADLLADGGQRARARTMLEPWAERRPDSTAVLSRLGRWCTLDRDFNAALGHYLRLCRLEQGNARRTALLFLARAAENAGQPEAAVAELERALADGFDSVELRRELGRLYARSGEKLKQGRLLLEEARAAKPAQQVELLGKAAELLLAEGATSEALTALEELRKLDPERVDVLLMLANVLSAAGRREQARSELESVLSVNERRLGKQHAKLHLKLAELRLGDDELCEAFEHLSEAHQLDRADPDAALLLGLLAADLDHGEVAFSALRIFVTVKEKSGDAVSRRDLSRAYTQLGELELGKGQRTVARRMANRALEADPQNQNAQRLMADIGPR